MQMQAKIERMRVELGQIMSQHCLPQSFRQTQHNPTKVVVRDPDKFKR